METIILGWYVLVETRSVLWLTVFGAVQYLGTLVSPLFGVAGDRLGHRNVLFGMRVAYAVLAAVLMVLAFAGVVTPLMVMIIATLTGLVRPSDLGVRGALVAETMPNEALIGAMSISRTTSGFGARRRRARGRRRVRAVRHGAGLCGHHVFLCPARCSCSGSRSRCGTSRSR